MAIKISGNAYGFLEYSGLKKDLENEIIEISMSAGTPPNLDLALMEISKTFGDIELFNLAFEAMKSGMNYLLEAGFEENTNLQAAVELSSIFIHLSQSPLGTTISRYSIVYFDGEYKFYR